ncbi:hypothetical protein [Kitasatospora cheerisanensis]|uniref:Uncharacterized protein n=1 Tax=Kitasatospora cheerisanensis KCTC 2395 TaxID=1348663 RepID=A0A066Z213_9ACTN|nr:hypothetical protein [Kitasatospora cheerisanensis]KDN87818.1 hypothetical protein KCH_04650 [Kitasatospora cheerisanensis KCTC 2395]
MPLVPLLKSHRRDRSPEVRRRGRRAAFCKAGVFAALLALDYLPILPA